MLQFDADLFADVMSVLAELKPYVRTEEFSRMDMGETISIPFERFCTGLEALGLHLSWKLLAECLHVYGAKDLYLSTHTSSRNYAAECATS